MATHRDALHDLIRALTPSEKRYFKLQYKTGGGTKSYILLFDAIEKQDSYDELELRNALKGQKLLNQLHVAKNYLYKQILRALRSFHAGSDASSSPFLAFAEHIGDMSILQSKGLFEQSKKALRKAEAIAEEYDDDLLRIVLSVYREDRISQMVDRRSASLDRYKQRVQLLERLRNGFSLKHSLEELYDEIALKGSVSAGNESGIESIVIEELPFTGQIDFCSYHCYAAFAQNNFSEAAQWAKKALVMFDEHPHQRERSTEIYLSFLSNYVTCLQNDHYRAAPELLQEQKFDEFLGSFDRVNARTAVQRNRVWATRSLAEFEWSFTTENDDRLRKILPAMMSEYDEHERLLSRLEQSWFYFTIAKGYFWIGELDRSIIWLNRLLDESEFKEYEEYYGQALLFSLMLHFELGNLEYLKSVVGVARRYFTSRELLTQHEVTILKGVEGLIRSESSDKRATFETFHSALHGVNPSVPTSQQLEFERWIKRHIR